MTLSEKTSELKKIEVRISASNDFFSRLPHQKTVPVKILEYLDHSLVIEKDFNVDYTL